MWLSRLVCAFFQVSSLSQLAHQTSWRRSLPWSRRIYMLCSAEPLR